MSLTVYFFLATLLFGAELLYLNIARHFSIVDVPNERSSHTNLTTVRGGGILFWLAALGAFVYSDFAFPYFFLGLTLAAAISFLDDVRPVANRYRIGVQFVAVGMLLRETGLFVDTNWVLLVTLVVGVGILNAYNFMDGVNSMTAFYSLITIGTAWYWQSWAPVGVPNSLFALVIISLLIFSYFNARQQAVCFAGDVGSVAMAVIVLYILLRFVNYYHSYLPLLLLAVYGVDSVLTITHRIYLRQNIFRAHRLHLFQLLVHRLGWPHLRVSAMYALVQLFINGFVLLAMDWSMVAQLMLAGVVLGILVMTYVGVKIRLTNPVDVKKSRL